MRSNLPTLLFLLRVAFASPYSKLRTAQIAEEGPADPGSSEFWTKLTLSIGLVLLGGVFAG